MHPAERVGYFLEHISQNCIMKPYLSKCIGSQHSDNEDSSFKISLISAFNYTNLRLMNLILWVFGGIPSYFQVLRCSLSTTEEDIELFFERMNHYLLKQCLILGVDTIDNELQRVGF